MYTVTLNGLRFLATVAIVLSAFNVLEYSTIFTLTASITLLIVVCYATNIALSKFYRIPVNQDSAFITALILFFVLSMPSTTFDYIGLALAAIVAMASKYIITWRSSVIFNPAAIGVFAVSITGLGSAAWWIADFVLIIPTLIVGTLILYKLRRFELFFAFLIPALTLIGLRSVSSGGTAQEALNLGLTVYPLLFLGAVMLTEPLTQPITRSKRLIYGAIVGIITASTFSLGFLQASPLTALLVGNLFAFLVTHRVATILTLVKKEQLTPTTFGFTFKSDKSLEYVPGQYIDMTIPGVKYNLRGNRRTFSIASHPSKGLIDVGVKFFENGSSFKQAFQKLEPGDRIIATNIAGEFTLPKKIEAPLVFVAGGIGITPFIPMIQDVINRNLASKVTLYYFVRDESEIAFKTILRDAKNAGIAIKIRSGPDARLDIPTIKQHEAAHFYLSGPPGMVSGYKDTLKNNGIKHIQTDYFTGY